MSIDEKCNYEGSKELSSIDSEKDRLMDSCLVMIGTCFVLFIQFLSLWTNDFVWANKANFSTNISGAPTNGTKTVFSDLLGFPEYRLLIVLSIFLTAIIFILIVYMSDNNSSEISLINGMIIGLIYVFSIVGIEALFIPNSGSYLGTGLLAIVQYSLILILLRRLTTPILPNVDEKDHWGTYRRNLRHRDRVILSTGIGIIVSLVIAILPTNSSVGSLITIISLAGPIVFVLIGIIIVGNHKLRRATESEYS